MAHTPPIADAIQTLEERIEDLLCKAEHDLWIDYGLQISTASIYKTGDTFKCHVAVCVAQEAEGND